jgi:hypothetical protein
MAKVCGIIAVALAIIAIFVPVSGILVSCVAIMFAFVAGLWGQLQYASGAAAIVGINSFLFSPVLFLTVMFPAQLYIAGFILFLVAIPFVAMWLGTRFPAQWQRIGILLSFFWLVIVPIVMNDTAIKHGASAFSRAERACNAQMKQDGKTGQESYCYKQGQHAQSDGKLFGSVHYVAVIFAPIVLGWLGACGLIALQRRREAASSS